MKKYYLSAFLFVGMLHADPSKINMPMGPQQIKLDVFWDACVRKLPHSLVVAGVTIALCRCLNIIW